VSRHWPPGAPRTKPGEPIVISPSRGQLPKHTNAELSLTSPAVRAPRASQGNETVSPTVGGNFEESRSYRRRGRRGLWRCNTKIADILGRQDNRNGFVFKKHIMSFVICQHRLWWVQKGHTCYSLGCLGCVCVSLDGSTSVENHHQWLYLKVMVFYSPRRSGIIYGCSEVEIDVCVG